MERTSTASLSGEENNDIHIVLQQLDQEVGDNECDSVTAELIPHLRPSSWSSENLNHFRDHPFRFTGQLFLDSDHVPCRSDGSGGRPDRASVWEIHPVYSIEICKSTKASKCDSADDKAWVLFHKFLGVDEEDQ